MKIGERYQIICYLPHFSIGEIVSFDNYMCKYKILYIAPGYKLADVNEIKTREINNSLFKLLNNQKAPEDD